MPIVGDLLADRYRIDGVLGAGGMASVYAATDLRLERQVAVKVLLPNLARDPSLADRFEREARILASVAHPNVAEVFDVEDGDRDAGREPFYVMELCEGGSLEARIDAGGPLEPGEFVPIIVSIAAALGELHHRGLIHRDVKPANILFTGGRPKLADFGLAKSGQTLGLDTFTAPGTAIGTPAYMAPELVRGEAATAASDIYALAATTFHGLTGHAPRQGASLSALAVTEGTAPPRVSEVSPRLGRAFDAIVSAALADDPAARPSLNGLVTGLVAALDVGDPAGVQARADGAVPRVQPAPTDDDRGTTRLSVPVARTLIHPRTTGLSVRPRPRTARRPAFPVGTAVFALAFVALALLAMSSMSSFWQAAGRVETAKPTTPDAPPPSAPAASSSSPAPTRTPSPSATTTPITTAPPRAIEAVDAVLRAIDAARGGHRGLNGGDANELDDLALEVGSLLRAGEFGQARAAAMDLVERARGLESQMDKKRGEALLGAAQDLLGAIPG